MSQTIEVTLSWADNSTGALEETGQEIDIYTDSPSFLPNVPINYSEARHPWMRFPPIAAGETTAVLILRTPVTFVKFRVRQYNEQGNGIWTAPQTFTITQTGGSAVPPAPTNLGMVVTSGGTPPPPPPTDPPPPPPPTGSGGSSSNYAYQTQFSGVQGQDGWSYRDSAGSSLVYAPADAKWNGNELYLAAWSNGFRHSSNGTIKDCVIRWTVPADGELNITGSFRLFSTPGSVTVKIQHNGVDIFSQDITDATVYPYDEDVVVTAGDTIDFISRRLSATIYNNNVELNPNIQLTTDGVTPINPMVSSLLPATLSISSSGVGSLVVSLSSPPSTAVSVSLSSSDPTKATVPASVTVPAGQTSAVVTVTGVTSGASTITATYNSSSKASVVSVTAPVSSTWSNAPINGIVLIDQNCSNKNGMFDVYGSTIIDSDATAPFSGPTVWKARLEALAKSGGNQLEYNSPVRYREMYFGLYWRTNPQYQGRIVGNKLFFLSSNVYNGTNGVFLFGNSRLNNGTAPLLFVGNSEGIGNAHILGTNDPGAPFFPNVGNGTLQVGVWTKIEAFIRASTTRTSQDGILRAWVNDTLVMSYTNINYCGANGETLDRWVQTQTWDESGDMGQSNTVAWEHYIDHLRIVGKN